MPNWTTNTVILHGTKNRLDEIKELLRSEENVFDFDKIIPMPASLNIESGGIMGMAMALAEPEKNPAAYQSAKEKLKNMHLPYTMHEIPKGCKNVLETEEDIAAIGRIYLKNQEKYGAPTWYDWRCEHWGTKWNSCQAELTSEDDTELVYCFDTAWTAPDPVMKALTEKYPDLTATLQSVYEDDLPYNIHVTDFQNGEAVSYGICEDEDIKAECETDEDDNDDEGE